MNLIPHRTHDGKGLNFGSNETRSLQDLLDRQNAGDASALGELAGLTRARVLEFVRRKLEGDLRLRRWYTSEDVTQDVMIKILQSLEKAALKSPADYYRWAMRLVRNHCIDLFRHAYGPQKGFARKHESADWTDFVPGPSVIATYQAEFAEMLEMLDELPLNQRDAFEFLHFWGFSSEQAAGYLKISTRSVNRNFAAAILALRSLLNDRHHPSGDPG